MFIVTEIRNNSLCGAWGFANLEEAIDRAMISIKEMNIEVDYYTMQNGKLTKAGTFTRKDMEQHLSCYDDNSSVCIGQLQN